MGCYLRKAPFSVSTCQQKAEGQNHLNTNLRARIRGWDERELWWIQLAPEAFEIIQNIPKLEIKGDFSFPAEK